VTTFDSGEALELSAADLELQARARRFVDEVLIPHEVEAELAGGKISAELRLESGDLAAETSAG
jgi:hypothetical protein